MTVEPRVIARLAAVAHITNLAREHSGSTIFVGIDGLGAAGKSTLARDLSAAIPGSAVVSIDDFGSLSEPEWDWMRFNGEVAAPLVDGRPARYRAWDWDRNALGQWREVRPNGMVIVEGVSATRREVLLPWLLTVWVDAPAPLRLQRARERDGAEMMSVWLERWMPSEQAYVQRERPQDRVDLIVKGV